ncbi:MAG: primosomal protein N' [Pseudomonadota bacterium]
MAAFVPDSLTYSVPPGLAGSCLPGRRVVVSLAARTVTGWVLGPAPALPPGVKVRPVLSVLDEEPQFPASMIPFFRWVASYYFHPLGETIRDALPSGVSTGESLALTLTDKGRAALDSPRTSPERRAVLEALADGKEHPEGDFVGDRGKVPRPLLLAMGHQGLAVVRRKVEKPPVSTRTETWVKGLKAESDAPARVKSRHRALEILAADGPMAARDLKARVPAVGARLSEMAGAREVELFEREVFRDPLGEAIEPDAGPLDLTDDQAGVLDSVTKALGQGFSAFLLHGVTGSGKTEVYLQAAARALAIGLSCVVLVPEIALITQMERRFRARFGDRVAVLHSGLSAGERLDQWTRIVRGLAPLVIGARSAVFAPVPSPGLFIVDEEHDESYKQESRLRYNARDLAVLRASRSKAVVLMGSATPSLVSRFNAEEGKFTELSLPRRVYDRPQPETVVVDLRGNRNAGPVLISPTLENHLSETLDRGEQALIFLNRRGFASFPMCPACGKAIGCVHCDITLTYHRARNLYLCHYCGYQRSASGGCPSCGEPQVKHLGMGTEKIQQYLEDRFPSARVARLDRDVLARKGALVSVLKGVKNREIDILVGTQMITKGHDYPHITLVGVVCADQSLGFQDYKAAERTFQILAQVAGRAGRGDRPGRVVLQTFNPEHFCVQAARNLDYEGFYATETAFRKSLAYPPYSRLAQVRVSGPQLTRTRDLAEDLAEAFHGLLDRAPEIRAAVRILGPVECPLARIGGQFRWQILFKGLTYAPFREFLGQTVRVLQSRRTAPGFSAILDVDPVNML